MEIVSEPDIRSPEEAVLYLRKLRSILRYLGTCDGNMEEGSLRCDANVSVRRVGDATLGTRCEIKNVNSMRFVARAIEYEAKRQVEILEAGGRIDQETRLFDAAGARRARCAPRRRRTTTATSPTPTCCRSSSRTRSSRGSRPACPSCRTTRRRASSQDYGLSAYDAGVLVAEAATADYFESRGHAAATPSRPPTG